MMNYILEISMLCEFIAFILLGVFVLPKQLFEYKLANGLKRLKGYLILLIVFLMLTDFFILLYEAHLLAMQIPLPKGAMSAIVPLIAVGHLAKATILIMIYSYKEDK